MPQHPLSISESRAARLYRVQVTDVITLPPFNVDIPHATIATGTGLPGDTLHCTMGNWDNTPTSYTYRWQRNGVPIAGALGAANPYIVVVADAGINLACVVTATNSIGSTAAPASNNIAIP